MAESFQRLGELWLDLPDPNRFVVFWTYSHPPTTSRMSFAARYDPWAAGKMPAYVKRSAVSDQGSGSQNRLEAK